MINELLSELESDFNRVLDALRRDLLKIRTGRANLGLLDGIRVEFYGTMSPLNQVGTLKVPDPRLITIQPWDKALIPTIEKSIAASDLGLNPSNDGMLIRIPIPPLTGERRKELVKVVKRNGEDAKVAARNERRGTNDMVKTLKKEGEISEDDMHRSLDKVQKLTDEYVAQIDVILGDKEKEILEF
jgi:ribosome recycling factor